MTDTLRRLLAGMIRATNVLMDDLDVGAISLAQWERAFRAEIARRHAAALMAGTGSRRLTPQQQAIVEQIVRDQSAYVRGFAEAVRAEGVTPRTRARATLYAGAVKESYWRGKTWGVPLPAYPTQGTQCMTNCGCSWDIQQREGDGNYDCTWIRGKSDSCQTCVQRSIEWSPVTIRDGELQL